MHYFPAVPSCKSARDTRLASLRVAGETTKQRIVPLDIDKREAKRLREPFVTRRLKIGNVFRDFRTQITHSLRTEEQSETVPSASDLSRYGTRLMLLPACKMTLYLNGSPAPPHALLRREPSAVHAEERRTCGVSWPSAAGTIPWRRRQIVLCRVQPNILGLVICWWSNTEGLSYVGWTP